MRKQEIHEIGVGQELPGQTWEVTMADIEAFGDLLYPATPDNPSRRGNPHLDAEFAAKHIFGGLTADGNHTVAKLCQYLADWLPDGGMVSGGTEVDLKFPNPVRPGDRVILRARVTETDVREDGHHVAFSVSAESAPGKLVAVGSISTRLPSAGKRPVYEWSVAEPGDTLPAKDTRVDAALVKLYSDTSGDRNPLYTDPVLANAAGLEATAVPTLMVIRVAPTSRTELMSRKGYDHPVRPTPYARWQCELFEPMKPGDVITAESQLDEKYEKSGRKYLVWRVIGRNQRGDKVVEYRTHNAWEGSKPQDRVR